MSDYTRTVASAFRKTMLNEREREDAPALLLPAVGSTGREAGVALPADGAFYVGLSCERLERRLDDSSSQAENEVEGRLFLDVVV